MNNVQAHKILQIDCGSDIGPVYIATIIYPKGSCFVWVSSNGNSISNLHASVHSRFSSIPSSTCLMNEDSECSEIGEAMSRRLAKKLNVPIFLSWNIKVRKEQVISNIEKEVLGCLSVSSCNSTY